MASPVIELKNINMIFDGVSLLKDINLTIEKGEKFVLIGPSGQGKSVLLKIMAGILKPTSGEILIEGKNIHNLSEKVRNEVVRHMGMLFQKNALFDSLTSGDNIAFPLREVTHLDEESIQEKIEIFLEAVAIPHAKDLFPDEISGGMQKRLGIARALALDPQIIFYDDPTAGLDPITSRVIIELIISLQKEHNSTVVAITNDMMRAYQLADCICMVVDGEMLIMGDEHKTKSFSDPRVHQFISGELKGPLTEIHNDSV